LNWPFVVLSNETDTLPAIRSHTGEIFKAVKISWNIFSFLMSSFLTYSIGFVNIINAKNLKIMGAFVSCKGGE